jgi:SAM-dependent methyltransferase
MILDAAGYVTDVPYLRNFIRPTMPAWLDHVAVVSGFAPPDRNAGFAWCDLGCGHGVTAAILAATHPKATVYGIDIMPVHIDHARRLAADAAIRNATFAVADFDSAAELDLPSFDYIVSHGVYSWVDKRVRESWRRFVDRHLKPGGFVYVSYNAMPGRATDLPLQRLLRALAQTMPGNSQERLSPALEIVNELVDLKAPALITSPMATRLKRKGGTQDRPLPFLTHEFMSASWDVLCVTDVRADLAEIGLQPVGSATLIENYDSFVLGRAARERLATIGDRNARELVRDFLINQSFRRDVFVRGGRRLTENERRSWLLDNSYALALPANEVEFVMSTPAGRLNFDNPASRHIVHALASGPRRLADIADPSIETQDLVANALTLCASNAVWPVESNRSPVAKVNSTIFTRLTGPEEINWLALPFGTAVPVDHEQLLSFRDGAAGGLYDWLRSSIKIIK